MSLISFHRILIAVAILFCASYGVYELTVFTESEDMGSLLLSGFFMVVTICLSYYLWHLKRFLGSDPWQRPGGPDSPRPGG